MYSENGHLYDYKGIHDATSRVLVEWDDFDKYDKGQRERIERDCIR